MKPAKIILFSLFATIFHYSYSQPVNAQLEDVILPAPNAASLGKYGDIPVSYFTGVPSINVPIFTLQEGSLNVPISLSYHASGIKVAETASWVGIGWSLNAGGMITRTILGIADEKNDGYYNDGINLTDTTLSTIQEIANGTLDSEPDLFNFNVNGYSGKFYFDQNKEAHFIPKQDLKIEVDWAFEEFQRFTIFTPDGTKYYFGNSPDSTTDHGIEKTKPFKYGGGDPNLDTTPSTWYLCRIESPDNTYYINFSYLDEYYSYTYLGSCQVLFHNCDGPGLTLGTYQQSCFGRFENDINKYIQASNIFGKRLHKISTSSGFYEVEFVGNNTRQDLDPNTFESSLSATSLDEIRITSGSECSSWQLSYDYFIDNKPGSLNRSEYKRLKLESIRQQSCDGLDTVPPYLFSYEGDNGSTQTYLPNRLSKAIDHWGFYNEADTNDVPTLNDGVNIPKTEVPISAGGASGIATLGRSNRESDSTAMKKGILNQITYPTGGATFFTYEANTLSVSDTIVIKDNVFSMENCQQLTASCCQNPQYQLPRTLTQTEIDSGRFFIQYQTFNDELENLDTSITNSCFIENQLTTVKIQVHKASNDSLIGEYETGVALPKQEDSVGIIQPLTVLEIYDQFEADTLYKFTLLVNNGRGYFRLFTQSTFNDTLINKPVGGLRVREIRNSPSGAISNNDIIKTYQYTDSVLSSQSSGVLFQQPVYGYSATFDATTLDYGPFLSGSSAFFVEQSVVPLGTFEGYHIGYRRVVEYNNGVGFKEMEYIIENPPTFDYLIPTPPMLASVSNGKLRQEKVYTESANTPLQQTKYEPSSVNYDIPQNELILKVRKFSFDCGTYTPTSYYFKQYKPRTSAYLIRDEIYTIDSVTTTSTNQYNSSVHLFPIKTKISNSDGRIQEQHFKYPLDYDPTLPFGPNSNNTNVQSLVNQWMIGTPIETQTWEGTDQSMKMTQGQITLYKNFGSGNDTILKPFEIHLLETNTPLGSDAIDNERLSGKYKYVLPNDISERYEERVHFEFESTYGSLIEQSLTDGTPVSYLWGYQGNRPIAQFVGATTAMVDAALSASNTSRNELNTLTDSTTLDNKLQTLRTNLSNTADTSGKPILITTYSYNDRLQLGSVKGPDEIRITYTYDKLGRLIGTNDDDEALLQSIQYNYQN